MSGILPDSVNSPTRFINGSAINASPITATAGDSSKCSCDAYVTWINSQLCNENGANDSSRQPSFSQYQQRQCCTDASVPVRDLGRDLRNGVVLARLAEKLGNERLEKVHPHPVTRQQMLTNVDEVLKFAVRWRVKMHPVLSTEIVDGDIRSTLRLVLALAAHFRPTSVIRQMGCQTPNHTTADRTYTSPPYQSSNKHQIISSFVASPDVYNVASPPVTPSRSSLNILTPNSSESMSDRNGYGSPSANLKQPQQLYVSKQLRYKAVRSPRTGFAPSPGIFIPENGSSTITPNADDDTDNCPNSRTDSQVSSPLSHEAQAGSSNGATSTSSSVCDGKQVQSLLIDDQEFYSLQTDIASAKKTLLTLQQLLFEQDGEFNINIIADCFALNGGVPAGQRNCSTAAVGSLIETPPPSSTSSNKTSTPNHENGDRLTVLQLRTQICDLNLTLEELAIEKRELECRLIDRERQFADMQASLAERDRLIAHLQSKVHDLISEGRREVAELKELATSATSPIAETSFQYPTNGKHTGTPKHLAGYENAASESIISGYQITAEDGLHISGRSNSTRLYYFNTEGAGPFCLLISKPPDSVCLRDVRHAFSRLGRKCRLFFVPSKELQYGAKMSSVNRLHRPTLDPSMATLELCNDDDPLPCYDGQVYCKIEDM